MRYWIQIALILLLSGCVTASNRLSDEQAEKLLDATYFVFVHQDQILADNIGQSAYNQNRGLLYIDYEDMIEKTKPLAVKVSDLNFRKDILNEIKRKIVFIKPDQIILNKKPIENSQDLDSLIESAPTDTVVIIAIDYKLDSSFKTFTVNSTIGFFRKGIERPLFENFAFYNSYPVSHDHTNKAAERILPIWIGNNQAKYRQAYDEGIKESVKLIDRILTERLDYNKLNNEDSYIFYSYSEKKNVRGKVLFTDDIYRKIVLGMFGNYYSIPTKEPTYKTLADKLSKIPSNMARVFIYCAVGDCGLVIQPKLLVDGKDAHYIYKEGFFYIDLKPGQHTLTFEYDGDRLLSDLISSQVESAGPVSLNVKNNQQYFVKFRHPGLLTVGYNADIVEKDEALKAISELQYKGTRHGPGL